MSKEAMKLAIEWIEKQPEEITASKYDVDTRYAVLKELEEALAKQEQDSTYVYASSLATEIWQKHYMKESPKFALLDTTEGVLTQIDNMTCGLVREKPAQPEQEQGEPVAWLCQKANGHFDVLTDQTCKKCFPVYTTPQPKHEQGYKDGYEAGWTKALNEAYSNREQEPVAWVNKERNTITWDKLYPDMDALYATPQRKPLTFEQVEDCFCEGATAEENGILVSAQWLHDFARAIEAAHGIKE